MARAHNPFAPKERSTIETPWGTFEVASPNKTRLKRLADVQKVASGLEESESMERVAEVAIDACAAGLENGDRFADAAKRAWDADEVTLEQLQDAATFVGEELRGEAAEGND